MSTLRARSLECRGPSAGPSGFDLRGIGAAAFHKHGIAVLPIGELPEMDRMLVEQICESRYGKRGKA
jgi:hypothetical protein